MGISHRDDTSLNERKGRFLELLQPVHDNLARFARSIVRNDEEARDLVGETVLRALEHFDELKDEKAFLSWLFTIAVRLGRRWEKERRRYGEYDEVEVASRPSEEPSPDVQHDIAILYTALHRLRDGEREALLLFEIAGLSLEEVREVQGGSLSGVKSRLVRGRKKLEKLLGVARPEGTPLDEPSAPLNNAQKTIERSRDIEHHITTSSPIFTTLQEQ